MSTIIYEGNYSSVRIDDQGQEFVHMKNEALAVPLTPNNEVIFIIEPSPAFGEPALILPGGQTTVDENHQETAGRELREEAGYAAARIDFLGELRPYSKYLSVRSFVYLARDLTPNKLKGDEMYEIQVQPIPLARLEELIADGQILDARVIAALYMTRSFLQKEEFNHL